ncbi:right-handed parallel beta-helix repeat-containing protein [Inquilinus sp. Marseille-Q2685]|uniref:right-handed parallel beta-helix repeat-containing protein n=1 Tax=Inquilinus sp. Marseille-Q2685 TaxID=2866581 RepID=UPI001CE3DCF1|nr:right-handed parallel beta-helix repeat-containing protein [Inquilinus sp. Marseille-Q2685]
MAIPTVDEVWADFNLDGSVKEPAKQDIRRLLRFIQAIAEANGMKTYPNKAAMDADLTQPDGKPALLWADPIETNNYPTVWVWDDGGNQWIEGVDRISSLKALVDQTNGGVDDLKAGVLGLPTRANFKAKTGYGQAWRTISSPDIRWTITETDGSYKIDTTGALPQVWPVGIKMPYDLVPGDTIESEFKLTAGTFTVDSGPFFGTDPATSGDISTGAILYHWRNDGIYGQNYTGTGGIVLGYETVPQAGAGAPAVPPTTDDVLKIVAQVLADRTMNLELLVNGISRIKLVAPALPVGRVVVGIVTPPGASATLLSMKRIGFNGTTVHVDGAAAVSGNGMIFAPVKTWDEAVAIARTNRLPELNVDVWSAELRAAPVVDGKIFPRCRIRGRGAAQTKIISADQNPTDWVLLGGTTKVYQRGAKNAAGNPNTANTGAVYLVGVPMSPQPWYSVPDSILPYKIVAPAALETETTGGRRISGGIEYVRLPDAIATTPNATPMEVAVSVATLYCIGAPQIECENIVFSRGGLYNVYLDRATAVFRHCGFEWAELNGTEDAAGNAYYQDCWWDAAGNDLAGRTFPAGYAETLSAPPVSVFDGCTFRRRITGDAIAPHGSGTDLRPRIRVHNCDIEDCAKDGIVPASSDFEISGCRIRRCAQAQIEVIGGATSTALPASMVARGSIGNCVLDPAGVGLYGYLATGADGGLMDVTLDQVHITAPVTSEMRGNRIVVAGRMQIVADFKTKYTNITTERDAASRSINANGVVTFTKCVSFAV